MKRFAIPIVCFLFLVINSKLLGQKIDIQLDYTISYLLPKSNDTIDISIANQGQYLYTDSEVVTNIFKSQFANSFGALNNDETEVKFLLKLDDLEMLFNLSSGKTAILMNLNLLDFLPKKDTITNEITQLTAKENGGSINLLNNEYSLYDLYPKSDTDDKLVFAFDKDYPINYEHNFSEFFRYMLGNSITFSMPKGIVVYLKDKKNQEVIRVIKIEKETRTLSADLSMYIN